MKFTRIVLSLMALMAFGIKAQAQITIDNTLTATQLVEDFLIGDGVEVDNITFNGAPGDEVNIQLGLYNGPSDFIEFDEGLVMASTDVITIAGELGAFPLPNPVTDDPDLVQISGFNINDAAVLEFDFLSTSDSIRFNYVFASNEYPSFTCTQFNDAFGFFLSGPGINGPFSDDAENIALIPGTDIPVAINTVNGGMATGSGDPQNCEDANPNWEEDSQYFVDNSAQPTGDVQFPGMTQTFTAVADVDCGEWYHIKLAIGDAVDGALDSGVFLEAGSFAAFGEVFVNVDPVIGGVTVTDPQYEDVIVAGCSEVGIELVRPDGLPVDSVFVEFGGTAIEGEDYELGENDTLFFFPTGIDTLNFDIITLYDGVPDENEEIIISVIWRDGCGEADTATASIPFVDPYILESFTEDVEIICPADQTQIGASASNGIQPYEYNWGDFGSGENVTVPVPDDEEYYVVQITDACQGVVEPILDSVLVTNSIPPPLQAGILPFTQPECPNEPVDLEALIQDGNPPYTIIWTDELENGYVQEESIVVFDINEFINSFNESLQVDLTIIDSCQTTLTDSVVINYPLPDSITAVYPPLTDNCPDAPIEITANSTGGGGETEYTWAFIQGEDRGAGFDPQGANFGETIRANFASGMNELLLTVTDKCHRRGHDMIGISIDEEGTQIVYNTGLSTYTDSVPVIKLDPLPNVITPNGDRFNDVFVVEGIETFDNARLEVYDRWGRLVFETNNYEVGSPEQSPMPADVFDGADLSEGTYFYVVNIDNGECTQSGELQLLRSDN